MDREQEPLENERERNEQNAVFGKPDDVVFVHPQPLVRLAESVRRTRETVAALREQAIQGDASAQYEVGMRSVHGYGVARYGGAWSLLSIRHGRRKG